MAAGETFQPLWGKDPGVIWAAEDLEPSAFRLTMKELGDTPELAAVKVGYDLAWDMGLERAVNVVRAVRDGGVPVIYDHSKAGIGDVRTAQIQAKKFSEAGVRAAIIFPLAGPDLERAWIRSLQDADVIPIVGGDLATKGFMRREGGPMTNRRLKRLFKIAIDEGVGHFIVPGNEPKRAARLQRFIMSFRWEGNYALGVPRWMDDRGKLTTGENPLGQFSVPIIGRAISENPKRYSPVAAVELYARSLDKARQRAVAKRGV